MSKGNFDAFLSALNKRESSGNPSIVNKYGYVGLYQMGKVAFIDSGYYKKSDGMSGNKYNDNDLTSKTGINTIKDILKTPNLHTKASTDVHAKAWLYIENAGLDKYIGQTIGGVKITESGLIAGYHLKGLGTSKNPGLKQFLESDSKIIHMDGKIGDVKRTQITEYIKKFTDYDIDFQNNSNDATQSQQTVTPKFSLEIEEIMNDAPILLNGQNTINNPTQQEQTQDQTQEQPTKTLNPNQQSMLTNVLSAIQERLFNSQTLSVITARLIMGFSFMFLFTNKVFAGDDFCKEVEEIVMNIFNENSDCGSFGKIDTCIDKVYFYGKLTNGNKFTIIYDDTGKPFGILLSDGKVMKIAGYLYSNDYKEYSYSKEKPTNYRFLLEFENCKINQLTLISK